MAEFFELTDLASILQQNLDTATADRARKMATGRIRAAAAQKLLRVTGDVVTLRGGHTVLTLPERPVVSVASVTGYASTAWELLDDELRLASGQPWPDTVTVTYTHGYETNQVPADLYEVALNVTARIMLNPADHRQESSGGYSASYAARLNGEEKKIVRRYRRTTACHPVA